MVINHPHITRQLTIEEYGGSDLEDRLPSMASWTHSGRIAIHTLDTQAHTNTNTHTLTHEPLCPNFKTCTSTTIQTTRDCVSLLRPWQQTMGLMNYMDMRLSSWRLMYTPSTWA